LSYKYSRYSPIIWHGVCNVKESITWLLLSSLSMEASRESEMFADMDIVSLGPLDDLVQGTASASLKLAEWVSK
jgi:hypothetical protein